MKLNTLIFALLFLTWKAFSAEPYDKILAVVDGEIILNSEVMTALYQLQNQPGFVGLANDQLRKKVLDRLIDDKVIIAVSKQDSIFVTDDELDERLDQHFEQLKAQQGLSQKQLEQAIEAQLGMNFIAYRKQMGENMRDQNILQKMRMKYIGMQKPTPKEVRSFFTEYKDSLPQQFNSMRLSHIQIPIQASKTALDSAYKLAKDLISKLDQGTKFENLVSEFSSDTNSISSGGDMGYYKKGTHDPSFERAAFRLEVGQYTARPVRTEKGFHVIKVLSKRDNELRTSQIFLAVPPQKSDEDRTRRLVDSLKTHVQNQPDSFGDIAKRYSTDKKSNINGGDLGWFTYEELKPQYKNAIQGIGVGQLSEVIQIDQALHFFKLVNKLDTRNLSLEDDWSTIENYAQNILSNRKMQTFTFKWRKNVYIEIRDPALKKIYGNSVNVSPVQ